MTDFAITPVYDVLLRGREDVPFGLYHLHVLTAEQLTRLYYSPNSLKAVQKRLRTLIQANYLQVDATPVKHLLPDHKVHYSPHYYYTLGLAGVRYLRSIGYDVHDAWRASKEVNKHSIHLTHLFELNDVLISAIHLSQADSRYRLERLIHEREFKQEPFEFTANIRGRNHKLVLSPDAFLEFRLTRSDGRERIMPLFIEYDRDTEREHAFRQKVRKYIALFQTGAHKGRLGVSTVKVAITTLASRKHLDELRRWTEAELASTNEPIEVGELFVFAYWPDPPDPRAAWLDPCWQLAYATASQAYPLLAA